MRKTAYLVLAVTVVYLATIARGASDAKIIESEKAALPENPVPIVAHVRVMEQEAPLPAPLPTKETEVLPKEQFPSAPEKSLLPIVNQPDIEEGDRIFLDALFRTLPALCRDHLEHVIVRYDPKAERGQATATTMLLRGPLHTLSPKKKEETIGVITHECGHIISLNALRGNLRDGVSPFPDGATPTYKGPAAEFYALSWEDSDTLRPEADNEDFVSGYAKENPFEDFAESFAYFILQEESFRERAALNSVLATKLLWMETYIADGSVASIPSGNWNGRIPWDVTKVPHSMSL